MAASEESQVGVGTTRPYYKLHVGGGEGNRGGIGATDITITGIATDGVANSSSGALNVLGISTFKGDIDLIGSAGISTVRWDASKDSLVFQDNAYARFGTGEDLKIWHDGSNSYIQEAGTGGLIIYGTDETLAVFTDDGSVQLYNNDSKKLETTGLGITVYGDAIVSGVTTSARLKVTGISTFIDDVDFDSKIRFDESESALTFIDNAAIRVGTGSDFSILHDGNDTILRETGIGGIRIDSSQIIMRSNDDEFYLQAIQNKGVGLYFNHLKRFETIGFGASVLGNLTVSGVNTTGDGNVNIGGATTVGGALTVTGNAYFNGDVNIAGDIVYDEITGRNLNITGFSTFANDVLFDNSSNANKDILWDQSANKLEFSDDVYAMWGNGTDLQIYSDGTTAFIDGRDSTNILGISSVTATRLLGIHTSGDGGGIGIGSTTGHVGYGITYLNFKGPGVSTVHHSPVTGITTIMFEGGGSSVGAAGTWQNDGTQGISTAKSVGINTVGVAVTALQGGEKGASSGIGQTFQGLYISNGMVVNDNALNGNHYIGTAFGGIMAGPVTVNGIITVDGNWAVV